MLADGIDVIQWGDGAGNNMIVRITLSSGRLIYGFATENLYGGDWDIGPTWNYLVTGDRPFLVDSGRRGKGLQLVNMIESAGFNPQDIKCVIISHGHEDHVGGLFELNRIVQVPVMAHETYGLLSQSNAEAAPSAGKAQLPASCWCCPMPESFYKSNCLDYHRELRQLTVAAISMNGELFPGVEVFHTPGHSPDSLALLVDGEAILPGDTILHEITPHPTRESCFPAMKSVLPDKWEEPQQLFGLRAYIRSLKRLKALAGPSDKMLVLPAHRLYYRNKYNRLDLKVRIEELVQHHIGRCSDFVRILSAGPKTPKEIAKEHFQPDLLKGRGIYLAVDEVESHCELMQIGKDVVVEDGKITSAGTENFRSLIEGIG